MKDCLIKLMEVAESFGILSSASFYKYDGCCNYCTVSGEMENGDEFSLRLDIKEAKEND
jgi:hypothetical protein